jgi:hypothetical protein
MKNANMTTATPPHTHSNRVSRLIGFAADESRHSVQQFKHGAVLCKDVISTKYLLQHSRRNGCGNKISKQLYKNTFTLQRSRKNEKKTGKVFNMRREEHHF